jgi:methylenetetrahydrofolate dehydrogenase (NADP+) / methenyltetrahydrofolate cyclohydrolase
MIVDGRAIAKEILARAKACAGKLAWRPLVVALTSSDTPATRSYLAIKTKKAEEAGCILEVVQFDLSLGINNLVLSAQVVDSAEKADAVIVQLPLPTGVDIKAVCDAIPIEQDADVLSSAARAQFEMMGLRNPSLLPPVVGAVAEIFSRYEIKTREKKAIVIGDGWLVGNPCTIWLKRQGANVEIITFESGDLRNCATPGVAQLRNADIIVSGAGSPHLIKPEMLKQGVVLIDAGTSESDGTIAGDADPACADKCSIFTPVPGGVGPLSVARLFDNVVTLAERRYT